MRKADIDKELDDFGRFTEPALLILISLADGPKHGYAMIDDIATVADVRFGPGTLYGAITRLTRTDRTARCGRPAQPLPADGGGRKGTARAAREHSGDRQDRPAPAGQRVTAMGGDP